MKEIFEIVRTLEGFRFKDILFQAEISSTGSLTEVLLRFHYNRCWTVHTVMAEVLERLSIKPFLRLFETFYDKQTFGKTSCISLTNNEEVPAFRKAYRKFKKRVGLRV